MKLINETRWSSADLKRLFLGAIAHKRARARRVKKLYIRQTRRAEIHGLSCGDGTIRITLPKEFRGGAGDVTQLAQVFEHEIDHECFDLDHRDMEECGCWWKLEVLWSVGMTVNAG